MEMASSLSEDARKDESEMDNQEELEETCFLSKVRRESALALPWTRMVIWYQSSI